MVWEAAGAGQHWEKIMNETITAKGYNGQVSFDGRFVTISRSGFIARSTVGKGEKRIPIKSLTAVQWKPATHMVRGYIQFTLSGGIERRSRFGQATKDAMQDENSVVFSPRHQEAFQAVRNAVEEAMTQPG